MSKPKRKPLSTPIMVRMEVSMKQDIDTLAKANGLSVSDIVRIAVGRQLPQLKSGRTSLHAS